MSFFFPWEMQFLQWLQLHRLPWLTHLMRVVSFLGDAGWFWILLSLICLLLPKRRRTGCAMALSLVLCLLLGNLCLKPLIARLRPYDVCPDLIWIGRRMTDYSFPSGHTFASFAASWAFARTAHRPVQAALLLGLAVLIGFSRMYMGVHYPTDVLTGAALGMAAAEIAVVAVKHFRAEAGSRKV